MVLVFVGVFVRFQISNFGFWKAFTGSGILKESEHDNFYTKNCAKELLLAQVRILCTEQYIYIFLITYLLSLLY